MNVPISLNKCKFIDNEESAIFGNSAGGAVYITFSRSFQGTTVLPLSVSECNLTHNGGGNRGGALHLKVQNSCILITESYFINNELNVGSGGAVYVSGGDNVISVKGGAFINNSVIRGGGGALYSTGQRTNFSFVNVQFHNNSATICGLLEVQEFFHDVNFTRSSFTSNRATGRLAQRFNDIIYNGSAVLCIRNASISVINSTFSNNSAVGSAGVMHVEGSSIEIEDSKFEYNSATLDDGVIYTKLSPNTFAIHRSMFSDNRAGDDGGVMYMGRAGSHGDVNESSFSHNCAIDRGGVFIFLGSTLNIAESSFVDNTATQGDVINACISEINANNVFETNSSNTTGCISYNNRPILPTEESTMATQTEETATTRSMVRRTAAIIVPPQTIDPHTTPVTPEYVTEKTMTETPSTTIAPQIGTRASTTSTIAQTDSVSTMGTTSQTEPTTNVPTESSTTTLQVEEDTTTAAGINATSERITTQSEPMSIATGSSATTGLQTEARTTTMPKTEEVHITTLPQVDTTSFIEMNTKSAVISRTEATGVPIDIRLTTGAKEDATDKLPSFTSNKSPVATNSLKGNSNAARTTLGSVGLIMISSAFILASVELLF